MRHRCFAIAAFLLCACVVWAQTHPRGVQNIVLVHGAWADGSGWKGVADILVKDGYRVSIVQEPETSFKEDVAATTRVLAQQDGPCVLVAHSYGGAVITEAGTDPAVVGLVYIAAHMPDVGESEAELGTRFPSDLSRSNAIKRTADGFTYLDPARFHEYFAADLPPDVSSFMARSQVPNFADNFTAVITNAAWRSKPSWMAVATLDRTINPDLERWYAARAKSRTVEISGASHAVYVSRPREVAVVIEDAASRALDRECRGSSAIVFSRVAAVSVGSRDGPCSDVVTIDWHASVYGSNSVTGITGSDTPTESRRALDGADPHHRRD